MSDSDIEILLSSDCEYKKLTAEIYFKGKYIALLNQDEGKENLKIEFPEGDLDEERIARKIDLSIFEKGLLLAKKKIHEVNG